MQARLAQRQPGHGPHLQLELRHGAGVLRVVAAVVRAGGHFIDHQRTVGTAVVHHEEFHAQHAHVAQVGCNEFGGGHRFVCQRRGQIAFKHFGHGQDAVAVQVALHGEVDAVAVGGPGHDDRAFGGQGQHFFQHAGHAAQLVPGGGQFFTGAHAHLALAVVTHAGGFQDAGQQVGGHGGQQFGGVDGGVGRGKHRLAWVGAGHVHKQGLFFHPILGHGHALGRRGHGAVGTQRHQCRGGHVLKLGGDGIAALHQLGQALLVVVRRLDVVVADQPGGAGHIGVQHGGEVAHRLGGMHKHAAQLAAAHHAQRDLLALCAGAAGE